MHATIKDLNAQLQYATTGASRNNEDETHELRPKLREREITLNALKDALTTLQQAVVRDPSYGAARLGLARGRAESKQPVQRVSDGEDDEEVLEMEEETEDEDDATTAKRATKPATPKSPRIRSPRMRTWTWRWRRGLRTRKNGGGVCGRERRASSSGRYQARDT